MPPAFLNLKSRSTIMNKLEAITITGLALCALLIAVNQPFYRHNAAAAIEAAHVDSVGNLYAERLKLHLAVKRALK